MENIEQLTESQKARFQEFIDKWTDIGLSTKPANRKEAEKGIVEAYKIAGLKKPKIVWTTSPLAQGITRMIIQKMESDRQLIKGKKVGASVGDSVRASVEDSVRNSVRDSVWASVGDSVWASVWASVGASVWASVGASVRDSVRASVRASVGASVEDSVRNSVRDSVEDSVWASVRNSVRDSVWASVGASVRDSVWASVGASVWASVGDSVEDSVWASVRNSVRDSVYGQHDANWLAFYDFFKDVVGLEKETKKLSGLLKISQNAGWFLPHKNICWVSERHNFVSKDNQGRLHNEYRMAVEYPDGWGLYVLCGVRLDKPLWEKIMTRKMSFKEVSEIKNMEQRMVALKYNPDALLKDGKLLEKSKRGNELWLVKGVFSQDAYFLKYKDPSTDRIYTKGVPPELGQKGNADECQAWSFSLSIEQYNNLSVET